MSKHNCPNGCIYHKYHCAKCLNPVSYSPANYASRPQDIPNPCEVCMPENDKNEQDFQFTMYDLRGAWADQKVKEVLLPQLNAKLAAIVLADRVQTREKADRVARHEERERMAAWMKEHKYDFGCYDEGCPFYNDLAAEAFIKYLNTNEE